jgi:hypothetical protein
MPARQAAASDPRALQPLKSRHAWPHSAQALSAESMDRLRGGFQTPEGLWVSFGIEQLTYINGNLAATTRLAVGTIGLPDAPAPKLPPGNTLTWVRDGATLTLPGLAAPGAVGTLIQNSLNDQHIQTLTIINAHANSLDLLQNWNLQLSIRDAVTAAVRR